jgi:hypothetical protein
MDDILIISHPSAIWPGARHLHMHETGRMLAVTRSGNPLRAAATRMIEEGYSPASTLVIRDSHALAADITGSIADALA